MYIKFQTLFVLALAILPLVGCNSSLSRQSIASTTLWVVTEQSCSDGINMQAKIIAQRMEADNENLTVQLDILPIEAPEREVALKQLRAQIMAGTGPDVYLMPTGSTLLKDYPLGYGRRETAETFIQPLFSDVVQAMGSGIFADIQTYYDKDTTLGKESLNPQVMDAGVLGGSRYVLPLRYNTPVLLTAPEDWEKDGVNLVLLQSSVISLVNAALVQEGTEMITGLRLPDDLSLLPRHYDYGSNNILLTTGDIAEYLQAYQAWRAADALSTDGFLQKWEALEIANMQESPVQLTLKEWIDVFPFDYNINNFNYLNYYVCVGSEEVSMSWRAAGFPFYTSILANTLNTVAIAKHEEWNVAMYPLRAVDGSIIASVTYYGAVGSSSQQPELAYNFLRQFLMEDYQWDVYRPRINKSTSSWNMANEVQTRGAVENSWPVRTAGSVPYLWSNLKYQTQSVYSTFRKESKQISRQIQQIELTDEDVPALEWTFDEVRFPVVLSGENSMEHALSLLNEEDGTPTDVDIDALAQKVYQELWFHLMEG